MLHSLACVDFTSWALANKMGAIPQQLLKSLAIYTCEQVWHTHSSSIVSMQRPHTEQNTLLEYTHLAVTTISLEFILTSVSISTDNINYQW